MAYFANPQEDLPQPWKRKRILFYAQGLKVYGQIPYILQRRLQAEFISNNAPFMGARLIAPTAEQNYTLVRYYREDGRRHSEATLEALLDWLYADKGFEWGIAKNFFERLDLPNWWQAPAEVLEIGKEEHRPDIKQLMLTAPEEQDASGPIT
jgi:hypothetical protein